MAYDNSDIEVMQGWGSNSHATNGVPITGTRGATSIITNPVVLTAGILNTIRWSAYIGNVAGSEAELKIVYLDGSTLKLRETYDIAWLVDAEQLRIDLIGGIIPGDARMTLDVRSLNINVEVGDMIGFFVSHASVIRMLTYSDDDAGQFQYEVGNFPASGNPDDAVFSGEEVTVDNAACVDFTVDTNKYIFLDDDTELVDGDVLSIPSIVSDDEYLYIILREVTVVNGDILSVDFEATSEGSGIAKTRTTLKFDSSGGTNIIEYRNDDDDILKTLELTEASDYKLDVHLWIKRDPESDGPECDVIIVDYENGQGLSDKDYKHQSVTSRNPQRFYNGTTVDYARRLKVTAGASSIAGGVVVCRKPIVAIGDSYVGAYTLATTEVSSLSNVGLVLGAAFTETRYVINAGIGGNQTINASTSVHSIVNRFNGPRNDIIAYRGAIIAFVNGPGINDTMIQVSTTLVPANSEDIFSKAIPAAIEQMVIQSKQYNEVIMCEMVDLEDGYDSESGKTKANVDSAYWTTLAANLKRVAADAEVPFAYVRDAFNADPDTYYYSDNLHPSEDGSLLIANTMVSVYENNLIPLNDSILNYATIKNSIILAQG